ncbi:protein of unknown function [Tistlia consotensis]|uniref:DUF1772 domain-containing protein n=1 Tax=Tistlia consotensis USBA 355 TaxID=560819 RepID=A0A1Y6BB57_9PROT|nr:DUF1772 domain-containing protein [Tistlia consotensis]SMF02344.1 protein of unknown function [Tistlia consotensis USBA 355]SNS26764.1 protein of unknown function [Tistlia consotensis]
MSSKPLPFIALLLTALSLVPVGAHFFELPNKLGLDQHAYFTVQAIYRGWAFFGIALVGAILADCGLAAAARRRQPAAFPWALAGALLMVASLAVFFVWVFPTNQATANWTIVPPDWERLRRHWEYGHAVSAILTAGAFCSVAWALLEWAIRISLNSIAKRLRIPYATPGSQGSGRANLPKHEPDSLRIQEKKNRRPGSRIGPRGWGNE